MRIKKKCFDLFSFFLSYRKSSIKPPGVLIYFKLILREGFIEMGGVGGGLFERVGLFKLEKMMASVL